jgi:hypothetical protein
MGAMMAESAGESLPKQMGAWSDLKGAYRLLNNDRVKPEQIGQGHRQLTMEALAARPVVLCVQDDTEIHGVKEGGKRGGQGGEVLHSTLAVIPTGELVGILDQHWFRHVEPVQGETQKQRAGRWRESDAWADAVERIASAIGVARGNRWIHVADRASDNLRFMHACVLAGHGFVVRAQHDRRVQEGADKLWEHMARREQAGTLTAQVGRQRDPQSGRITRQGRAATLAVRYGSVRLESPKNHPGAIEPLEVRAVYLVEERPPEGIEAVDWMILTSEPVASFAGACVIAGYYQRRWVIEEWHRVLKEGCALEESQLEEAKALRRLSAIDSVVAVRMLQLRDLAQGSGQRDAAALRATVDETWIQVVATLARVNAALLTPAEFWKTIAKKGGFIGRKSDGRPGWKVIWRGWYDVSQMVRYAHAARELHASRKSCG